MDMVIGMEKWCGLVIFRFYQVNYELNFNLVIMVFGKSLGIYLFFV